MGTWLIAVVLSTVGAIAIRLAARALAVPARFVIGLGPRVRPRADSDGAMELRWIPIWVSTELRAHTPRGRAVAASAAGPAAVVALPFVVTVALFVASGIPATPAAGASLALDVAAGSAAEAAGIESGDRLIEIEGERPETIEALAAIVRPRAGEEMRVTVERAGARRELVVVPDTEYGAGRLGVTDRIVYRDVGLLEAVSMTRHLVALQYGALATLVTESHVRRRSGPVAMMRRDGARTTARDFIATLALLAGSWTSLSPLFALLVTVGQLRQHVRAPAAAEPATVATASTPVDPS